MDLVFFLSGDLRGSLGTVAGLAGLEARFFSFDAGMTAAGRREPVLLDLVTAAFAALREDFFSAIVI